MSEYTKHEPGTFSWVELGTTDQAGAKAFYTELFGWSFNDSEMEPGNFYTMFMLRNKPVAAGYKMGERMAGIPPHWLCYVTVASADDAARKVTELGGKVMMAPFDVMTYGRMTVVQDPTGATLALWEAREHIGVGIRNEPSSIVWSELLTGDTAAASKFYTGLFGWRAEERNMGTMTYTAFWKGEERVGGMMPLSPEMGQLPPHWVTYFGSQDVDATAERAKSMGGKVMAPPFDVPGIGRFAWLTDPQGASFCLAKFAM